MGFIKIQNGYLKNKKIFLPQNSIVRPMLSRIKNIFFNFFLLKLKNSYCLDCFSGSGSLGIESISCGAKKVFFIEKNYFVLKQLKNNLKNIKSLFKLINTDIILFLNKTNEKFDFIFIDPPLNYLKINKIISIIYKKKIIKPNSYILIETLKINNIFIPNEWTLIKSINRKYVKYILLKT